MHGLAILLMAVPKYHFAHGLVGHPWIYAVTNPRALANKVGTRESKPAKGKVIHGNRYLHIYVYSV